MESAFTSKFLEVLDEQMAMQFTGRVNILQRENGQLLGVVILKEGNIIFAKFGKIPGIKGLVNMILEDIIHASFNLIVEPEIVEEQAKNIFENLENLVLRFKDPINKALECQKLKPPVDLKIKINKDFILDGGTVSAEEFDVLCTISDFNKVDDIYRNCNLFEYQTTISLVSLREKKGILVIPR